jgi:hypothetical protein
MLKPAPICMPQHVPLLLHITSSEDNSSCCSLLLNAICYMQVYAESTQVAHDHSPSNSETSDEPSLHTPPNAVEGHSYCYSISMSQVRGLSRLSLSSHLTSPKATSGKSFRHSTSIVPMQVLRVVQQGTDVIIYFQPDTAGQGNGTGGKAARFACEFASAQVLPTLPCQAALWVLQPCFHSS